VKKKYAKTRFLLWCRFKIKIILLHASGCKCGKFKGVFKPLNTGKHINSVKYFLNTKASVSDPSPDGQKWS
jgi:hypothetical protein